MIVSRRAPFVRPTRFGLRHQRVPSVSAALVVALVGALLVGVPARAEEPAWEPPQPQDVTGIPVTNVEPGAAAVTWSAEKATVRGPAPVVWPSGEATVSVPQRASAMAADGTLAPRADAGLVKAAGLPVKIGAGVAAAGPHARQVQAAAPARVRVAAWDRSAVTRAGRDGVVLALNRADGKSATGPVTVQLSYAGFAHAYGGDWASRLRLVQLPECAATTPERPECRSGTPIPTVNDPTSATLTAQVPVGGAAMLLATSGGSSGDNGDYTATGLSAAGTWQVSNQTGAFSWSLPLRVPPALGGPAPSLAMAYSSGSVDGRTATTNNQGSWVGDGWEMWPGYIERTYASCADDNPSHETGDKCWFSDNATLSLNGHAGELIQDGSVWRLKNDDGTRAERLTDVNRGNGDNDNEYWRVTTPDGVQYYFGYHRLPGWSSGKPETNSTWTVPVYGNNAGEPCHLSTFNASWCAQAWRWNLDYVVDPNGNTMAYFYGKETGAYGRNNGASGRTTYDRGGYLERIEYGLRAGSEYTQAAPLRVVLTTAERCLSGCWSGTAWSSDPVASAWPDTPWDQYCKTDPCTEQTSATFWTARRLTKVTTQIRTGESSYADVESWTLRHEFLNAGVVEGTPMWLRGVTHAGHVTSAGGTAVTDPEITFDPGADPLPNRVDGPDDGLTALNRWRIKTITTESGAQIHVTYSPTSDCSRANPPNPETNTTRCMPSYWAPEGAGEPTLDWFHKYVVTRIDVDDLVTDQPNITTWYDYLDDPAWAYNTDELTKDKYRTWGDWRGYGRVQVRQGDATGQQTAIEYRYLRGLDGDKAPSQPGGVRDVWVSDSWGGTVEDHEALQGFVLQTIVFNGPGGAEVSSTVNTPWRHGPTATRTRNNVTTNAWVTNTGTTRTRTALAAGGFRITRVENTFTNEGLPSTVSNLGDEAQTGDETCTRTSYARNDTIWMIDRVSATETLSVACSEATTPAAPATVLSRSRSFYDTYVDESSFGAAPTNGNVLREEVLDHFDGTTPVYVATTQNFTYDANGRVVSVTDARGTTTTTTYTTEHGGLVVGTTVTNALSHQVVTVKHPAWDLPTKTTDPNGAVTELTYDGLGRLTAVWLPGRNKATQTPNLKFSYLLRNDGPTAVTTETLLPAGNAYKKSINLYDGLLRQRQSQIQAVGGGRLLTDTFHDTLGNEAWVSAAYYDSTDTPPGTSLGTPQGQIPAITVHQYDGAGRETASIFLEYGVEKWRTTTSYGGDRTHVIPPEGGIATTDVTNALGQIVEHRQYHDPEQVGSDDEDDYDATTYEYDLRGALTKVTDPAGNVWTYAYDLQGRQISTTDPDKGTTTTTYDAAGNVVTTTSPLGTGTATLAFTYDQLGRKTSLRDDSPTGTLRAEWIYDTAPGGIGKLARAIRYTSGGNYESRVDGYDNGGRATSTTIILPTSEGALCAASGSNPCQYTTSITYRQNGATSQSTVPAVADLPKEVLTYGYNDIGEPTTLLTAGQIYVNTATYNKLGQLIQRQLGATGSRVAITSTFDEPTRRLLTTSVVPELQPEAAHWEYSYDDYGNVTRINEAPVGQLADTQCFTYDYLARLSHAWTPADGVCDTPSTAGLGGPAPYWHSWTYDTAGNRLTETRHHASGDTVDTYAYPAPGNPRPHATTQVQTTAPGSSVTRGYTYDNAGNLKTRMSDDGDLQTYTFDPEGHIASVEEDGTTTSFVYDADGTRLIRRDASGSVLYLPNGTEVAVATGSSTATATRYYSHVNATIAMRTAAGLTWLVGDHHGTAELAIDRTTLTVVKRRSLPFGQERGTSSGWPSGMDKGFVGGTKDPIGLTHLGLREYEPALGRFISVDPVIDVNQPHQLNPYAYGFHNPVTQSDPNGDWPSFLDKAVSKVTSTVSNVAKKAASKVASAASSAANAVGNFVASTVESIKEDPLKFAVGLAVGVAATVAVAAVCSTGVGCLVLAGAVAGAATAGAEYGVDVAQGDREFSVGDLAKEMAIGGAIGGATAGLGAAGSKLLSGARNLVKKGGCNSFVAGTPVLLADGTTKPIEEVQVGDAVLATDPESGLTETEVVTATIVGEGTKHLVEIEADTDGDAGGHTDVITATDEHPFWVPSINEWLDASDLEPGQWLQTSAGTWIQVTAVRQWNETATVHNLTVSDVHTYYVLAGDTPILVHNAHCVDVEVYGPDGKLKDKWNETSGNMTPEEAALGRGYNSQAATHTENRVARSCGASSCPLIKNDPYANTHRVSPGDTVMIRGTLPPCYRCRGALNRAYRETGANYIYTWPSASGGTNTWRANGGRGFQRLLMKLGII